MKNKINISRRKLNKSLGLGVGLCILQPYLAYSAVVTPSQVEGPFHPDEAQSDTDMDLCQIEGHDGVATGEQLLVRGRVLDLEGEPVEGALVDVWQANHYGRYSHPDDRNTAPLDPNFQGWGLIHTDKKGVYGFKTIKPGPYPLSFLGADGMRCRHIHFKVSHPNYRTLTTQMYFAGDPLIAQDLEIAKVAEDKRHLLIADPEMDRSSGLPLYHFDLFLGV